MQNRLQPGALRVSQGGDTHALDLRCLIEQIPDAMALLDRDLRFEAASHRWREWLCPHQENIAGRHCAEVLGAAPARWGEVLPRALHGETAVGEAAWSPPDGARRWVRWRAGPRRDMRGEIVGVIITAEDATAEVEAMRALRRSREELDRAQRVAQMGSWRIDPGRDEIVWSPECCRILGLMEGTALTIEAFLGIVHPEDRERVGRTWKAALAGTPYDIEHRIVVNGEVRWVRERAEPERDASGRLTGAFGTMQDITAARRAEQALRESEERLRLSTEAAGIGTFTVDLGSGTAIYAPELAAMLGFPSATRVPLEAAFARVHRDDVPHIRTQFEAAQRPGSNGLLRMDLRFVRPGGEVRWMTWNGRVEFADTGRGRKPVRILGACVDITERKKAERVLLDANSELERRVAQRAAELEREMERREAAQAALARAQRLESVGRLAGGLAHDFNNTLAAISANLELALPAIADPGARQAVQNAMQAVEISAGLNRRLLTFTRRAKPLLTPTDINERVGGIVRLLSRTLGGDVVLTTDLGRDLWRARLDPGELDSALLNLALNARDAMPRGGTLAIETRNVTLDGEALPVGAHAGPADYVRILVRDTGTGMSREVMERALEPFFTTKDGDKRTGLGLSSVGEFVRISGGFLALDSAPGEGTTISIQLPRAVEDVAQRQPAAADAAPLGDGELVLLVDDNDRLLEAEHGLLEGLGYAVATARNGQEAMAVLESGAPVQVVLSDIVMPGGMSGYDVARRVLAERPGIAVLLASGYHDTELPGGEGVLEHVKVLRKPYSRAQLAQALQAALAAQADSRRALPA